MVELASPAGGWSSLVVAVDSGCDSVYFGLKELSMRANAQNFELGELKKISEFCHSKNVKCYLTLNTVVYDSELQKIRKIVSEAKKAEIDAVIAWDFSVITECMKQKLPVHLSTQASVSNFDSLLFYSNYVSRIVLARELSLEQISELKKKIKKHKLQVEIECFAHGAMCVAVSGRCFTSQFLFGKSANRGECLQPCRRTYKVTDIEEGFELALHNNSVMSPKDLCTIQFIDKLVEAGVDVFKIEGRNRSPEYVNVVTECYRQAIDAAQKKKLTDSLKEELVEKLKTVYNREFSSGFYMGLPTNDGWTNIGGSAATETKTYVGRIRNYYQKIGVAEIYLESGKIKKGDSVFIIGPTTGVLRQCVESIQVRHKEVNIITKGQNAALKINSKARKNDKVFLIGKA
jgi:putative protease